MAALLPQAIHTATSSPWPSRKPSLSMSPRKEMCRVSVTETNSPERLPHTISENVHGLPYTSIEWSKAISDVKREYLNRRYRSCATRCSEILDNLKDSVSDPSFAFTKTNPNVTQSIVEPAYLIYLHFYAANSQEMLALELPRATPARNTLLNQARDHYQRASSLINAADSTVGPALLRRPSGTTTTLPSLHSADSSVSSYTSSTWSSSHSLSPASSISSIQSMPVSKRKKKRVTFSDVPMELLERPDSPTLGLGSFLGPARSTSPEYSGSESSPIMAPLRSATQIPRSILTPRSVQSEVASYPDPELDPFRHARSVHRYSALLTSLQRQVFRHLNFIESELEQPQPIVLDGESPHSATVMSPGSAVSSKPKADKTRSPELQARIERLRAQGWERKRFDARRYAELRESASADMAG
ncbi:Ff.00g120490.m01.CDS01 [Fusarium sp. VM40]|nr:Ff.00g120490.m01.CDS01 [Fusarium sp. VM40]